MDSQNSLTRSLCVRGCGFYGSEETSNMCSKCYKVFLKEEVARSVKAAVRPNSTAVVAKATESATAVSTVVETAAKTTAASSSTVKNRCQSCNKKVGLTGFPCKCGKIFCGAHRYPKEHSCTFDYKTADRQILEKENPVVKSDKLDWRI